MVFVDFNRQYVRSAHYGEVWDFFSGVADVCDRSGGNVNQYLGDGLLALFGVDTDRKSACRQALHAAAMVAENVEHLNRQLAEAERTVIRFGIGINGGEVIVGDIGYGENAAFTALGDAVNVAAQLQDMSKELNYEVARRLDYPTISCN